MKFSKLFLLLLFSCLFQNVLLAQPFQGLYSYGNNRQAGIFEDVASIGSFGIMGSNVVTIGTLDLPTTDGLVAYHRPNGVPVLYRKFRNPSGNPVEAEAITATPSFAQIACFFDPVDNASDIVRLDQFGTVIWLTRLQGFHVKAVDVDIAGGLERIWLTGQSVTNQRISLQGLNAGGGLLFAHEYDISAPVATFSSSKGLSLNFNPVNNRITIAGEADVSGGTNTAGIFLQTNPAGTFLRGRAYMDAAGNNSYHAKDIIVDPGAATFHFFALDFSSNGNPIDHPAAMHIDNNGTPIWIFEYLPVGPFFGTNYQSNGIVTDGTQILTCGTFLPDGASTTSSYSLALDFGGFPLAMNEYSSLGNLPEVSSQLKGMDLNPLNNLPYMVGDFESEVDAGSWPQGPIPYSFRMIASNIGGGSSCSDVEQIARMALGLDVPFLNQVTFIIADQVGSPLTSEIVTPFLIGQCRANKTASQPEANLETELQFSAAFLPESAQIQVNLTGELQAPASIRVYDLHGRTIAQVPAQIGQQRIDASGLSRGIYLVAFDQPGVRHEVKKLIVH